MMLELLCHEHASFVTLTYNDDQLVYDGDFIDQGILYPRHAQLFLKRLRKEHKVRYFLVGEYGPETLRPHYHAILYGYPGCHNGRTIHRRSGSDCCPSCADLAKYWSYGGILQGEVNQSSIRYVANYTTKKLGDRDGRLSTLPPPFTRMSRRPGIGAQLAADILRGCRRDFSGSVDVPEIIRHDGQVWAIPRYLRVLMRRQLGRAESALHFVEKIDDFNQAYYTRYLDNPQETLSSLHEISAILQEDRETKRRQLYVKAQQVEARSKIKSVKGSL